MKKQISNPPINDKKKNHLEEHDKHNSFSESSTHSFSEGVTQKKENPFFDKPAANPFFDKPAANPFLTQTADSPSLTSPIQKKGIEEKENNTGLPDNLKAGMEKLSGISMDDVKVHHNSDKPAQLQAHAYAQGTDIHLAPGQEQHLPHELGHVVQQKQGRVQPTTQMKGIGINDNEGLEQEADIMGAKALQVKEEKGSSLIEKTISNSNEAPVQGIFGLGNKLRKNKKGYKRGKKGKKLGGGTANTVYKTNDGYFKPDDKKKNGDYGEVGLHNKLGGFGAVGARLEKDPHMATRAVASSQLDQALGLDILAKEKFDTVYDDETGKKMKGSTSEGVEGKEMFDKEYEEDLTDERAQELLGTPQAEKVKKTDDGYKFQTAFNYNYFDFKDANIQKGFADLQAIDYITGQVDRHGGNIFIDSETNQVKGIDNDAAFQATERASNSVKRPTGGEKWVGIPDQIHVDTAEKIKGMSSEDLIQLLQSVTQEENKQLTEEEIRLTVVRFEELKAKIAELEENDELIDNFDDDTYKAAFNNDKGSYLGRMASKYVSTLENYDPRAELPQGQLQYKAEIPRGATKEDILEHLRPE